jgi:hypothetical protein
MQIRHVQRRGELSDNYIIDLLRQISGTVPWRPV